MHEMSLIEGVFRLIEEQAKVENFRRVITVRLDVGELSHAEPDALRFCFEAAVGGTSAKGAALEIVHVPGLALCMRCDRQVALRRLIDGCPDCGGHRLQVVEGAELRLKELEVE